MPTELPEPTVQKAIAEIEAIQARLRLLCNFVNQAYLLNNMAPPYPKEGLGDLEPGATTPLPLRSTSRFARDEFTGKPFAASARRILEVRKETMPTQAPASVDEIHEALREGGYIFDVANVDAQKAGIRIALGKNSQTFMRIPGSDLFGLNEWYGVKPKKQQRAANGASSPVESASAADSGEEAAGDVAANPQPEAIGG